MASDRETYRIELPGETSGQAQQLAAELIKSGIQIGPPNDGESIDRSVFQELAVAIVAAGSYDLMKATVISWAAKLGISPDKIRFRKVGEGDPNDDEDGTEQDDSSHDDSTGSE